MIGFSVVIPAFGRPDELRRAVESVAAEQPDLVEIVIVDDCSPEPLEPCFGSRNGHGIRIRVVRLSRNRGPGVARAMGVRRARQPYIAFLDSDDTFEKNKLDVLGRHLSDSGADLVFHPVEGADFYNGLMAFWSKSLRKVLPFNWLIALINPIPTPGLVVRRLPRLGHPNLRHAEDWAFLLRYVDGSTRVDYVPRLLARLHRPIGSEGGLSHARAAMRAGEFAARRLVLRRLTVGNLIRFALGSAAGSLRLVADKARHLEKRRDH